MAVILCVNKFWFCLNQPENCFRVVLLGGRSNLSKLLTMSRLSYLGHQKESREAAGRRRG